MRLKFNCTSVQIKSFVVATVGCFWFLHFFDNVDFTVTQNDSWMRWRLLPSKYSIKKKKNSEIEKKAPKNKTNTQ